MTTTAEALAASIAVGERLGLPTGDPVVVSEGYSTRVRLGPALTRVITVGQVLRGDPLPWLTREVEVGRWLAGRSAPILPPWSAPGPYVVGDVAVSLWTYVPCTTGVDEATFGAMLGELHAVLDDCPLELPLLPGPIGDVAAAVELTGHPVLRAAADRLLPLAAAWPRRVVHGDAHVGNVVVTADGPRWTDLEDVGLGPAEWDLSPSSVTAAVLAAYPGRVDTARLADCRALRWAQSLAADLTDDIDTSKRDSYVAQLTAWLADD